jgi:hypothetical protein
VNVLHDGEALDLVVAPHAIPMLENDPRRGEALAWCALDFRYFLRYWWFLDQESGTPRILGDVLWPGQLAFVDTIKEHQKVFALKARKLGFTTLECAWDAWVLRFRGKNERVHLFSRREDSAIELLRAVMYGMNRLPEWMKLPIGGKATHGEVHFVGGPDDTRIAKAYPANEDTAVEATATHGHVDEWARMLNPRRVWQAIEPSMANTCHFVTTGMGPANYSSEYWLNTLNGDTPFHPFFVKATMRPDRTEAWVNAKRKGMGETEARREYPMTWKDSLYAGADLLFAGSHLDACGSLPAEEYEVARGGAEGREARRLHIFRRDVDVEALEAEHVVKAWDIGRHRDAAVGTVWDYSEEPATLLAYVRLRQNEYPEIGAEVESLHERYPGTTVIEDNAAGEAVRENLEIDRRELDGWKTTPVSKPRMISKLERAIQNEELAWSRAAVPQLHNELEAYQLPDDRLVQDSVMSMAIALGWYTNPKRKRRKKGRARIIQA